MELECAKCGKKFIAKSAKSEFCTHCVSDEFSSNKSERTAEQEFLSDGGSRDSFLKQNKETQKRQQQRALRLKDELAYGSGLSPAGKIRYGIGLLIFLFSLAIAFLNDPDKTANSLLNLTPSALRIFCILFGLISTAFIITSSKRHRFCRYFSSICVLGLSIFTIDLFELDGSNKVKEVFIYEEAYVGQKKPHETTERVLNDQDLKNFNDLRYDKRTKSAYAIFVDHPDPVYRTQIRDYFHRNLEAENTSVYSRNRGYLYVIGNAPFQMKDISKLVSQIGSIYYADIDNGIYEIEYNSETARMSNRYSQDVINTPTHPAYVYANIEEMQSKIPERVGRAAQSLAAANSPTLRLDILNSITAVLEEPWATEPQTYNFLITALITYSSVQNEKTAQECLKFVQWNVKNKKANSPLVINYLIDAKPDIVAPFIIEQWTQNPIVWNSFLEKLGAQAETLLIEKLKVTKDIQLINSIIHHFGQFGTAAALPYVKQLEAYPDRLISQAAQKASLLIMQREENKK